MYLNGSWTVKCYVTRLWLVGTELTMSTRISCAWISLELRTFAIEEEAFNWNAMWMTQSSSFFGVGDVTPPHRSSTSFLPPFQFELHFPNFLFRVQLFEALMVQVFHTLISPCFNFHRLLNAETGFLKNVVQFH